MILITGASGNLGSLVINELLKNISAENIIAFDRNEQKSKWKNTAVKTFFGDYSDKNSLRNAFKNVDKLLLISSSNYETMLQDHQNVIDVAKEMGVGQIFYTSGGWNTALPIETLGYLRAGYTDTENYIKKSGLDFTIFRNAFYAEALPYLLGEKEQILQHGVAFSSENGRVNFALRTDMAKAITKALLLENTKGLTYTLSSKKSFSMEEITKMLSKILGREIPYHSLSDDDFYNLLKNNELAEQDIFFLTDFGKIFRSGIYDYTNSDLASLLGEKPTEIRQFLTKIYN